MTDKQPLDAHGIEIVKALAVAATGPVALELPVKGDGLPENVLAGFDRASQRFVSIKALAEEWRTAPARRKGTAKVDTLAAFIALTNRHKDAGSALFAQSAMPSPSLTAVLNYHGLDHAPRFGDHRVLYDFPLTDEFKVWVGQSGKPMGQGEFAAFLEEHAAELAAPMDGETTFYGGLFKERFATPSELIALSRSLEVFVGQKIKRQERLSSGERVIEFAAEHTDAKGQKVDIPGIFMVSVPAFVDGQPVRIPARLRYRAAGADVIWYFQLYRPEALLREEVQRCLNDAAAETGLPGYEGKPEA